jgi:hypothetical protein
MGCGLDVGLYTTCRVNIFLFFTGFEFFLDSYKYTLNRGFAPRVKFSKHELD